MYGNSRTPEIVDGVRAFLPRAKGVFYYALAVRKPPFHEGFSGQPGWIFLCARIAERSGQ